MREGVSERGERVRERVREREREKDRETCRNRKQGRERARKEIEKDRKRERGRESRYDKAHLATSRELKASGTLVPAAMKVRPITLADKPLQISYY